MRSITRVTPVLVTLLSSALPSFADKNDMRRTRFDTQYIASDFIGACAIYPSQIHDNNLTQKVLRELDRAGDAKINAKKLFAESKNELGVDIRNVDRIVILFDRQTATALPIRMGIATGGGPSGKERGAPGGHGGARMSILSIIANFTEPVDQKAVTTAAIKILRELEMGVSPPDRIKHHATKPKKLVDALEETVIRKHEGTSYRVVDSMGICFPNDKTVLISHESLLKKMITAKDVKSTLTARLLSVAPKQDVILVLDLAPFAPLFGPKVAMGVPLLENLAKIKSVVVSGKLSRKTLAIASVEMANKQSATAFSSFLNDDFLPEIRTILKAKVATLEKSKSPVARFLITLNIGLLNATKIVAKGTDVSLRVAHTKEIDSLPEIVAPIVAGIRESAMRAELVENLHKIGLAFHNYHETHGRFPGAGSDASAKSRGLSWRVHLLPFLDEGELYKQFKMNEPWDSDHNKKLIRKMPKVFTTPGVTEKGKTSLHVFVGKGTPFERGKRPRMRDIVDGMAYTLFAVVAGPDKADIWTKPGGLPFDPKKDPVKVLGKLPEYGFMALFMDSYVRTLPQKIDSEQMRRMIQHADGKPVGDLRKL